MKKTGYAVIGSGFGDEGKGLTTDFLARKLTQNGRAPIVVRCNGGAQAGHTVETVDGLRHVFGHVGSGTFAGSSTFLSSNFIVNPFALHKELDELKKLDVSPIIEVHPACQITTVYDMALNGIRELARGSRRHGSCGMGINETVTRARAGYGITLEDLNSTLQAKMDKIQTEWFAPQLSQIDITNIDRDKAKPLFDLINVDEVSNLLQARDLFNVTTKPVRNFSNKDSYIFEGAQGLMLDEFLGEFPHVTRSVTGLPSMIFAAKEVGVTEITPIYVTRCYTTRHGAGPLVNEDKFFSTEHIQDKTNITGEWQGSLRFAPINLRNLESFIAMDRNRSRDIAELLGITINQPRIMVTCIDQVGDLVAYNEVDRMKPTQWVKPEELVAKINKSILPVAFVSYGPTANNVKEYK